MNILVTGADGQLGRSLRRVMADSADRCLFTDVDTLDITDPVAVRQIADSFSPDVIVNCAAYTNVDRAESDPDTAERLNAVAPGILAAAARDCGALLVHISTDYVFGSTGVNSPLLESDPTGPTSVYGATKLRGEEAVVASGCRYLIFRTAWLYSEYGRNFLLTMLRLTSEKDSVSVVFDQTGSPTYAGNLAEAIYAVINRRLYEGREGIYHFSDEGVCSWFDFARTIARFAGNDGCRVNPCRSSEYPSPVRRPSYSVLDKSKFKTAFGLEVPYWTDSLLRCVNNIKSYEA